MLILYLSRINISGRSKAQNQRFLPTNFSGRLKTQNQQILSIKIEFILFWKYLGGKEKDVDSLFE